MSTIVSHVVLTIDRPKKASPEMVDKWALGLVTYAEIINQRRQKRVPNENKFQELIATNSSYGYQPVLNPSFVSRSGKVRDAMVSDQAANLKAAFDKYEAKLNHMFQTVDGVPAKRFKEAVEAAKELYRQGMAQRDLPFTGFRLDGRGPAAIAAFWLTADVTATGLLRPGDQVLEGGPYLVCFAEARPGFKAGLCQRLVQAGAAILKANLQAADIDRENGRTNHLVQSLIDPGLGLEPFTTGGPSHVDYIVGAGDQLFLDIRVSRI